METEPRRVSDAHQGDAQAEIASLEDALAQLTAVATRLVQGHRELEEEAVAIQAEMDTIHNAQDARARQIAGRLQSAGASILAFGDPNAADQVEAIDDDDAVYAQQ